MDELRLDLQEVQKTQRDQNDLMESLSKDVERLENALMAFMQEPDYVYGRELARAILNREA